jgi:hypothetical protein
MSAAEKRSVGSAMTLSQVWPTLFQRLRRRFPRLDCARIEDAIAEAILRWWELDGDARRNVMDEIGGVVLRSLYRTACRNVSNGIRMDRRRGQREQEYARRKKIGATEGFFVANGLSAEDISIEDQQDKLQGLLKDCCAWERAFVALRQQGCRQVMAYAEVLGEDQCPLEEQR